MSALAIGYESGFTARDSANKGIAEANQIVLSSEGQKVEDS